MTCASLQPPCRRFITSLVNPKKSTPKEHHFLTSLYKTSCLEHFKSCLHMLATLLYKAFGLDLCKKDNWTYVFYCLIMLTLAQKTRPNCAIPTWASRTRTGTFPLSRDPPSMSSPQFSHLPPVQGPCHHERKSLQAPSPL